MTGEYWSRKAKAARGLRSDRLPHWEYLSNPDAETLLTGIDYYDHPRECRLRLRECYPQLELPVPETDAPVPRPRLSSDGESADRARHTVRWGAGETTSYLHGEGVFHDAEEVFAFSPLAHADFTGWEHVVNNWDFTSEEAIYQRLRRDYPAEWGDTAPPDAWAECSFYNTMFMWPLLTFGWELFLECCLEDRFARVMEEFLEINRRTFRAFARLPIHFVTCHDDIVMTRGPVCSPQWMKKYIFPAYEELFGIVKAAGKRVLFMTDGCIDAYADDVVATGAQGFISEPYTDYRAIARKHRDIMLAGEGDNRILSRGDPAEIRAMVDGMRETAAMTGGYMMGIGNHIPWNVPPESVKLYLDYAAEK